MLKRQLKRSFSATFRSLSTTTSHRATSLSTSRSIQVLGLLGGASGLYFLNRQQSRTFAGAQGAGEGSEVGPGGQDPFAHTKLYQQTPKIDEGYVKVSDVHTIYYHVYGNPAGKPVLIVHGGPGGGTAPEMARYFDPEAYRVVLVDQRGCGKSYPFASLEDNTTWASVSDFEKIRKKLGIEKWMVFGGSWGSTLGLTYAISHPERCTELVLRGIFLLRKKEIDWFYQNGSSGAGAVYPAEWALYEEAIPPSERCDYLKAYGRRLRGDLGDEEMSKAAKAWATWEGSTSKLNKPSAAKLKAKYGDDKFSLAFARIENHYFTNKGFFPRDGWLLEKENLDKIRNIPTFIVQGQYDMVCPAMSAYELKKALPTASLKFTTTGHSGFEEEIIENLVMATEFFKTRVA